ncbi:MAG: radical protein [Thermoleophilia bacterium]|nr:radical protein [Thermoleophilia bacterium]
MPAARYTEHAARSALYHSAAPPQSGWTLNPYTGCSHRCTFCYVRAFEVRAGRPSDGRYGQDVRVKVGLVEQLRRELARGKGEGGVTIGTATDPYQPAEGRYRLTRECIRALGEARVPISIITRGPLVVRDLDVLAEAAARTRVLVNVSIPTVDEALWRATEPGTAPPRSRLRAVRMLADAGIETNVALAPLLPDVSDTAESVRAVSEAVRAAGASGIWICTLSLRPGVREHFMGEFARTHPGLVPMYERLYGRPYLQRDEDVRRVSAARREAEAAGLVDRGDATIRVPPPPPALTLFDVGPPAAPAVRSSRRLAGGSY